MRSDVFCLKHLLLLFYYICLVSLSSNEKSSESSGAGQLDVSMACNSSEQGVFQCDDETCVPNSSLCNGIPDCASGNDESVAQCGCLPNEFRCRNSCIDLVKRCDRHNDCGDFEDELNCESFVCPVTHLKCDNHFCVPLDKMCDFEDDCGDNSDESKCVPRQCWKAEFKCKNGECIRPGYVCDGIEDCKDGSDEIDCGKNRFVKCGDGSRLHRFYACDGWPDCSDNHADETDCGECSDPYDFQCPNGRCIKNTSLCDSQCDCLPPDLDSRNCADEIDCDKFYKDINGIRTCKLETTVICIHPNQDRKKDRCIHKEYMCSDVNQDGVNECHIAAKFSENFLCYTGVESGNSVVPNFTCPNNRTIPATAICDYKKDCLNGEDEQDCYKSRCSVDEFQCVNGQCVNLTSKCDLQFDCWDKSDELYCEYVECFPGYKKCTRGGQCVRESDWCDYFPDCFDGSDEEDCSAIKNRACGPDEFRCENGQCISAANRCYDSGNPRDGCFDGTHLTGCKEWYCPQENFKCRNGPCLNYSLVCNDKIDCAGSWDDEDKCPFSCSDQEPRCECQDIQINCTGLGLKEIPPDIEEAITRYYMGSNFINNFTLNEETFHNLDRIVYLDLKNNSIYMIPAYVFRTLWRLRSLNLQDNRLSVMTNSSFFGLSDLRNLHLQGNKIQSLEELAFYGLSKLQILDLSKQEIVNISPGAFVGLRNLITLDLSFNKITDLREGTFKGLPRLETLNLEKNLIKFIESNVFRSPTELQHLTTDEFRFCCLARHVASCLPPPDEFSSCEDLMSNIVLRVCVWVLGVIATCGNALVIAWRMKFKHTNQVHSFLITNLAIGDLFMGSYLLIIASVDAFYRGVYFIHDSTWRSSSLCHLAGFISTFSSELSVFTLTVITLDRFLVIIFPFSVQRLEMPKTRLIMAGGWVVAAFLSGLPLLPITYFRNFYGRSGVCLALHITPEKPNGWEYSVFVFLFLNFVSFTIIALGYLGMYMGAKTTRDAVQKGADNAMARRMTLIVSTDALCWMPIILLGVFSLCGFTVPPQVFAWVAVFVLPLNAAVNPVLYTLSTAPFLGPARRGLSSFKRSCRISTDKATGQHRTYSSTLGSMRNNFSETESPINMHVYTNHMNGKIVDNLESEELLNDLYKRSPSISSDKRQKISRWRPGSCHVPLRSLQPVDTAVTFSGETIPLRRFSSDRRNK